MIMGKRKIDPMIALKMRIDGATLRDIGKHFGVSPEGVRQCLLRADKTAQDIDRLKRLLKKLKWFWDLTT
jgi:DNA-directed RNA polymerase sigma subunit (sigma70/sigma32)